MIMATRTKIAEKSWQALSPDEKLERRLAAWLSPSGVKFATSQSEADYRARVTRITDAIKLRKTPDRVPVLPNLASFASDYCGYTQYQLMYDVEKVTEVAMKCTLDFQLDQKVIPNVRPGKVLELIDYKLYNWPGHGVAKDGEIQFIDADYMKENEYDAFIKDASDYWTRTFLPRVMGALGPLHMFTNVFTYDGGGTADAIRPERLSEFGNPEAQSALEKLMQAGRETLAWQQKLGAVNQKLTELGFPTTTGSNGGIPFDRLGDYMRGQRGIVLDMLKQPDKLLEAMEKITPLVIKQSVSGAKLGGCPIVGFAPHKGADGFMSDKQFRTFYWPTFRRVIMGLIEEGLIPRLFAEGGYNSRLEVIRDLPKGKTIWHFDYTDMAQAKEVLGDVACIMGNVPLALLNTGTPDQVTAYCRKLIDTVGKDGGFILATGAGISQGAKVENVRAMIKCAKEYGVYS